ncbi:hypothetical protein CUMW_072440 [Citrus unshiu]|nr:hypothetical protein CUMW_072440 [Citrus unshiu]
MRTAKHTPHNGRRSEAFEDVVKPLWFESFLVSGNSKGVQFDFIDEESLLQKPFTVFNLTFYKKVPVLIHNGKTNLRNQASLLGLNFGEDKSNSNSLNKLMTNNIVLNDVWFMKKELKGKRIYLGGEKIGLAQILHWWLANFDRRFERKRFPPAVSLECKSLLRPLVIKEKAGHLMKN